MEPDNEDGGERFSSSVSEQDRLGAARAIAKAATLQALFAEPFYPVHVKAQRNVPIPPELNLSVAYNAAALEQFLSGSDVPEDQLGGRNKPFTLSSVSFLPPQTSSYDASPYGSSVYGYGGSYSGEDATRPLAAKADAVSTSDASGGRGGANSSSYSSSSTPLASAPAAVAPKSSEESSMFYLNRPQQRPVDVTHQGGGGSSAGAGSAAAGMYSGGGSSVDLPPETLPLSALLASGHEAAGSRKSSSRKSKKHDRHHRVGERGSRSSRSSAMMQTREVAPAGSMADLSSEDESKGRAAGRKKGSKSLAAAADGDEDEVCLACESPEGTRAHFRFFFCC